MHDIHSAFVQKAIDKWNMTPILDSTPSTQGIVAAGTCEWCSIFVAISSPPNKIAIESIFTEEPASIVVDLNANSLALYAMSPIEARYIVAKNIPWNDDEFWSLHGDYLKFVYEIDKRFGKKNIESNFVRDFKKAFDLLDASWQNIGANAPTQQLTLTTLLRLLFIANIADRGALDGRKSFLFEAAADDERNARSIYRSTIRPLFFDTLNKPHARRNAKAKRLGNIPFLNGGLFAPLQIEAASTKIDVPNSTILSILHSLFEPYSWNTFAAEDNSDPRDSIERRSHALDSWMLGHIFEMLMPASLRESSGSFYTPMPLAQAIVDRAFETWIGLQFHLDRDDIHALFHRKLSAIPNEQLDRIDKRLAQIRILDPAAGSGAFLQAAFDRLLALRSDIAVALSRPITRTQLAKYILTTNLYGIDILPAATQICELRLWLELIRYAPKDGELIPLPNLELNISCGDALLDLAQWQRHLGIPPNAIPPHMPHVLRQFKTAHGYKKKRLRLEIERCSASISDACYAKIEQQYEIAIKELSVSRKNIFESSPIPSPLQKKRIADLQRQRRYIAQSRSDSMHLGFDLTYAEVADQGGFDLVIGNPPWFGLHALPKEKQSILRLHYKCAQPSLDLSHCAQSADISSLFVEKALRLVKKTGCVAMLVPNKLFSAPSYKPFRSFIENHAHLLDLCDWSQTVHNAFGAATYPASIILSINDNNTALSAPSPWIARIELAERDSPPKLALRVPSIKMRFDVRRGICTGANDVYVCKRIGDIANTSESISAIDDTQIVQFAYENAIVPIESTLIYDVLRGCDIRPYCAKPQQNIVIPHNMALLSQPLRSLPPHAQRWFERVAPRLDERKTTRPPLRHAIAGASPTLNHKKVVWRDIAQRFEASYCNDIKIIPINTVYYIPVQTDDEGYLLAAWLNSAYVRNYCNTRAEHARGGYRRFFAWLVDTIPWPFDDTLAKPYIAKLSTLSRKAHDIASKIETPNSALATIQNDIDLLCDKCVAAIERHTKPLSSLRHPHATPSLPLFQQTITNDERGDVS